MQESTLAYEFIESLSADYGKNYALIQDPRANEHVKRGLRNADGSGVMAGYTQIGNVTGYALIDGERVPMEGKLTYRGYDLRDRSTASPAKGASALKRSLICCCWACCLLRSVCSFSGTSCLSSWSCPTILRKT